MNLFNILKNQLIEVIEWTDDSRDTLSYRWPDDDKEIKNGAQLIVRESQQVQFVAAGQYADLFGPGKHTLSTENVPILSTILGWKYGFQSPFKCDVYWDVLTPRVDIEAIEADEDKEEIAKLFMETGFSRLPV